jgi:hypothetical protein
MVFTCCCWSSPATRKPWWSPPWCLHGCWRAQQQQNTRSRVRGHDITPFFFPL